MACCRSGSGLVYAALITVNSIASALRFYRQPGKTALLLKHGHDVCSRCWPAFRGSAWCLRVFYDATPWERASWLLGSAAIYQTLNVLLPTAANLDEQTRARIRRLRRGRSSRGGAGGAEWPIDRIPGRAALVVVFAVIGRAMARASPRPWQSSRGCWRCCTWCSRLAGG